MCGYTAVPEDGLHQWQTLTLAWAAPPRELGDSIPLPHKGEGKGSGGINACYKNISFNAEFYTVIKLQFIADLATPFPLQFIKNCPTASVLLQ